MILYPQLYINNVKEITINILNENKLKGLILDVDNTLIDYDKKLLDGLEDWIKELKKNNIKLCILSNSNKKEKVESVATKLEIPFIYFAKKPFKTGFLKAKRLLDLENQEIGVIGDQIFTDIIGANRCKMYSILTKPIDEKDIWVTLLKRPLENYIIKRYLKNAKEKK